MDLNDMIAVMAASILAGSVRRNREISESDITSAVNVAHEIWIAVLKKDRES